MAFAPNIKEDALVACGRHCCICHKFCGTKIEVHHIRLKGDGGEDIYENAIPLCFDCHADMTSYDHKHPKGTKYSESELRRNRDNWYQKVEGNIGLATRQEVVETDKRVYEVLVNIFPWDRSLYFIRRNNFSGFSFELKQLDDLYEFMHHCQNPAFEFLDTDIEGLRVRLLELIQKFTHTIGYETFPTHTVGWNCVPDEWLDEQPERFNRVVNALHNTAESICETYDSLVKTATRKLGILPPAMAQS